MAKMFSMWFRFKKTFQQIPYPMMLLMMMIQVTDTEESFGVIHIFILLNIVKLSLTFFNVRSFNLLNVCFTYRLAPFDTN